jgi:hypothetical protein
MASSSNRFPFTEKIGFQRGKQEALAETARAAQEVGLTFLFHIIEYTVTWVKLPTTARRPPQDLVTGTPALSP